MNISSYVALPFNIYIYTIEINYTYAKKRMNFNEDNNDVSELIYFKSINICRLFCNT